MNYVYVLQSRKTNEIYIGQTSDLTLRFDQHNSGKSISTKNARPWKLIYYEAYLTRKLAFEREKQLKRFAKSFSMLKKRKGLV